MKYILALLLAVSANAGTINLAWDYSEPDASGLAGFEIRVASNQGDLGGAAATATSITLDAADDNAQVVNGETVGFEGSVNLSSGIHWVTVRAFMLDNGTQVFGPSATPIRVVVTPSGIIRVRIR